MTLSENDISQTQRYLWREPWSLERQAHYGRIMAILDANGLSSTSKGMFMTHKDCVKILDGEVVGWEHYFPFEITRGQAGV